MIAAWPSSRCVPATYVHPGEQLTCQGCHERKHSPPSPFKDIPLALRRAPSKITPAPEGANPFSYPRLVQPVLDRHCVECHRKEEALDLSGTVAGDFGWSKSYQNLAWKYGFLLQSLKRFDQIRRPWRKPHDPRPVRSSSIKARQLPRRATSRRRPSTRGSPPHHTLARR